jgi:hypothetical protein
MMTNHGCAFAAFRPIAAGHVLIVARAAHVCIACSRKPNGYWRTYVDKANKLPSLFPENSKSGGETKAGSTIWEKPDEFKAQIAKFAADAKAALDNTKDLESFKC